MMQVPHERRKERIQSGHIIHSRADNVHFSLSHDVFNENTLTL